MVVKTAPSLPTTTPCALCYHSINILIIIVLTVVLRFFLKAVLAVAYVQSWGF